MACKGYKNETYFPTNYNKENKKIIDNVNLQSTKKKGCFLFCSWFSIIFLTLFNVSVIFYFWVYLFDDLFIILREIIVLNSQYGRRSIWSNNITEIFSLSHPTGAYNHYCYLSQSDKDTLFYSNILHIGDLYLCEAPLFIKKLLSILCLWTGKSKKPIQKRKITCVKCFSFDNNLWSDHY